MVFRNHVTIQYLDNHAKYRTIVLMPWILAALSFVASALFGANLGQTGNPLVPPNAPSEYAGTVCIDESMIGDVVLEDIPKPNKDNLPFPDSDKYGCNLANGSCIDAPERANYRFIAGAESVIVERIWPHEPSTRLMKQKLPADAKYDQYRDFVYRPSCNDWCQLKLPYGGTFYCDFLFLFKPKNDQVGNSEDWVKRRTESGPEWYPKDGSEFQVLMRDGAKIPDYAGQEDKGKRTPIKCSLLSPTPEAQRNNRVDGRQLADVLLKPVQAQDPQAQSVIRVKGLDYVIADENGRLLKQHLRPENTGTKEPGRIRLDSNHPFRGVPYDVYQNLSVKIAPTDRRVYLTAPGAVENLEQSNDPFSQIPFLEFSIIADVKPNNRSLQLGTFTPFLGRGWWKKWVDESKPAIYLYPPNDTMLDVSLGTLGKITVSDPLYDPRTGWQKVLAHPDGKLEYRGKTYPYLFYEAILDNVFIQPQGSLVRGSDLVSYFADTLPRLGLNTQEAKDFVEYWLDRLSQDQPYYFIHWLSPEQIAELEPVSMTVVPDSEIRIRAYFQPLAAPMSVSPQELPVPTQRRGFTLVEWGGILDR